MNSLEISPGEFRALADEIVALAARYLSELDSLPSFPQDVAGTKLQQMFSGPLPENGLGRRALASLPDVIANCRPSGPRFLGYVAGSGEPVAACADFLASVLNQITTAWRSSPAGVTIERTVVGWLAEAIGCPGFSGSLTGGGSSANLMGLTMARESKLPANEEGAAAGIVYASDEAHMSIAKAVALLGLGRRNLRLVPTDEQFRLDPGKLERAIQHDLDQGRKPIAVVASAGTVNTGAIDPLHRIAEIAQKYGLWLHVDGAYGALAALAVPESLRGLHLADSLSLDPHKWLYQPYDCGCLLFREAHSAQKAFSHSGDYAKSLYEDPIEGFAFFEESLELSRRFRALKIWVSLRYHGLGAFRDAIRSDLSHAHQLAREIEDNRDLELLAPVGLSAVCFRYSRPEIPEPKLNELNMAILKSVVRRGRVFISNASIRGKFALRACFVNHRTTSQDVVALVEEVLAAAREL
jgi:glutamate/tyrosine decarboxylase-like PLP-dependent enzyme